MLTPASEALAFRIWRVADPVEWNLTSRDVAELLREPVQRVSNVVHLKGWTHRLRNLPQASRKASATSYFDAAVTGSGRNADLQAAGFVKNNGKLVHKSDLADD